MEQDPFGENVICWLCDNGLLILAISIMGIVALLRWSSVPALSSLPFFTTATPTSTLAPLPSMTPAITATITTTITTTSPPTVMVTVQPTPTPVSAPGFVLVFVPLHWQSGRDEFERMARQQAENFIVESGIENFFTVDIVLLETGMDDAQLGSEDLVYDLVEFGLARTPGDRYIGLTDGDIAPEGISDVVGWTSGGIGVVGETSDTYVSAHELGHTFGLCDEYSYQEWFRQNEEYLDGCPNPYPPDCSQDLTENVICDGSPTADGRNSIMGPAGLSGEYGFNPASLTHLQGIFQEMAELSAP